MKDHIGEYIKEVQKQLSTGIAAEHAYRPALQLLLQSADKSIIATNDPKRIKCGAPDFIMTKKGVPLGYIEAKDIGKSLDTIEDDEQMKRYRESLGNLILTDYLEFRWYVRGEHRLTVRIADVRKGKIVLSKDGKENLNNLLSSFLSTSAPLVNDPKELAMRMAAIARTIRFLIFNALSGEYGEGALHLQMDGFRKVLLHDLTENQFADMYAQTICYGLFAARCHSPANKTFSREIAAYELPRTNPFLRKMFSHIAGPELDERIVWIVDDLASLLDRTDMGAILENFGKRTRREDPIFHFYETFLSAYDPKMREARGVYYTPEPVVKYMVQSVNHIIKSKFGLAQGLADASKIKIRTKDKDSYNEVHKVLILDPATGTGTFLHEVIGLINKSFKKNKGMWSGYVSDHLLPRVFGFELLMAPYAVAHMKLGLQLIQSGYDFRTDERVRIYLTNTLEEAYKLSDLPLFAKWLAEEANAAGEVKKNSPVMVIIGNPPYSVTSLNKGFDVDIRTNYYPKDEIREANPKVLLDDYVKFIRFAQQRIEQTGYGVLAFITNHGYLANPTFRGMRQSLMSTFDDIFILDLHGNSKKKEKCPDGSKDENVFDIQQGVAIGIFIKNQNKNESSTIHHAHLWGLRETYDIVSEDHELSGGKYLWLSENHIGTTEWTKIKPQSPFYLFIPQDISLLDEYEGGWKITDIMPITSMGIKTNRDHLLVDMDKDDLIQRISNLASTDLSDDDIRSMYNLEDSRYWNTKRERQKVREIEWRSKISKLLYRPFDTRWIHYQQNLIEIGRGGAAKKTMKHMLSGPNLGLITARQVTSLNFEHVLCTRDLIEMKTCSHDRSTSLFPLYVYSDDLYLNEKEDEDNIGINRNPNFSPAFINAFKLNLKMNFLPDGKGNCIKDFGPEDIFSYIYAVLHSPTYRSRYAEFLRTDFPKIPITSNSELFRTLCILGRDLWELHLMERPVSNITTYPIFGNNMIETVNYSEPNQNANEGRVWINNDQYFEGVSPEVWSFQIGGYAICHKWLKDRKGRRLTFDELNRYQQIIAVLDKTISLMAEIDNIIPNWPIQ